MDQLQFSVPEIMSLLGLAQCVYVLVYMGLRAGDLRRAALPFLYFFVLGSAFFLDFAQGFIGGYTENYSLWQWAAWFMGPPLSVLLIIQIAQITKAPPLTSFAVLLLIPLAYGAGVFLAGENREALHEWLVVTGLVAGAVSMLGIWLKRGMMKTLAEQRKEKERYYLILTLIFVNTLFLGTMILSLTPALSEEESVQIRTVLGLAIVYLTGTSLFRIYPQAVTIIPKAAKEGMTGPERDLAARIEQLLDLDKVYHEPAYGRADLARELKTPEAILSKVINTHFGKSFPQLLNERRVEDAKRMLIQTDAPVKVISSEVGFNAMASFNRVFKESTGIPPSRYREENKIDNA